jgi:hypothetical protein
MGTNIVSKIISTNRCKMKKQFRDKVINYPFQLFLVLASLFHIGLKVIIIVNKSYKLVIHKLL